VARVEREQPLWGQLMEYAENCTWVAGKHLAMLMRENRFSEWESVFAAIENGQIIGYCTFLKTDYYPENRYSPWISSMFVEESFRGRQLSGQMIDFVCGYAREKGFRRVYIPTDTPRLYERFGFTVIDSLTNYGGDVDKILAKDI
jgi:GNAT superfamily N-acetyltransferase